MYISVEWSGRTEKMWEELTRDQGAWTQINKTRILSSWDFFFLPEQRLQSSEEENTMKHPRRSPPNGILISSCHLTDRNDPISRSCSSRSQWGNRPVWKHDDSLRSLPPSCLLFMATVSGFCNWSVPTLSQIPRIPSLQHPGSKLVSD